MFIQMAPSAPTTSTNTTFNTQFGFGWIEVSSTDIPSISVKGSTLFTRLPPKQRVTQFKQRYPHFQAIHESQRRKLKINNHHIWRLIDSSISSKSLSVSSRHTQETTTTT
ncbi:hypothetical protein RIR_jg32492.t1 [Rhizophagus irregularis DAOM 181602=DAOM 197198]|nr:hypothetical protein RIR_jg32492.t1 [Rhizophagus irregularis DAOM 181602=DAOM 197198]